MLPGIRNMPHQSKYCSVFCSNTIIQLGHKDLLPATWSRAHRQHLTSSGHFLPSQGYYLQLACSLLILWLKEYDSCHAKTFSIMLSDTAGMGEAWMNKDPISAFLQHPICTHLMGPGPSSIPGLGRSTGEGISYPLQYSWASLVNQLLKSPPAMQETWV